MVMTTAKATKAAAHSSVTIVLGRLWDVVAGNVLIRLCRSFDSLPDRAHWAVWHRSP